MEKSLRSIKLILLILLMIALAYLLQVFSFILIPIVVSLFITLLCYPVLEWMKVRKIPFIFSISILIAVSTGAITGAVYIMKITGSQIALEQDNIKADFFDKFDPVFELLENSVIQKSAAVEFEEDIFTLISPQTFVNMSHNLFFHLRDLVTSLMLTIVFLFIFIAGISKIENYIKYVAKNKERSKKYILIFKTVIKSLSAFLRVKFIISLATGICVVIICKIFGIHFAVFWGLLTFILSFIQLIGTIIITSILLIFGYIQIDTTSTYIIFIIVIIGLQLLLGNFVEPYMMGKEFSINTASIIIGLIFWTYIWGIAGAILAVPILVLIKEILNNWDGGNILSRVMGFSPKS